jgi:alpha-D-ribose 1-methylphosphonate 5-triphosphate synthase subunit PhnH
MLLQEQQQQQPAALAALTSPAAKSQLQHDASARTTINNATAAVVRHFCFFRHLLWPQLLL